MMPRPTKKPKSCKKAIDGKSVIAMVMLKPKPMKKRFFSGKFFKSKKEERKGKTKMKAPSKEK